MRVHDVDLGLIVGGSVLIAAGWGGAIAWSAHYFSALPVGVASCNDTYAGINLIPVVGPLISVGALAGCANVQFVEWLVPVLSSVVQIPGLVLVMLGVVGADAIEYRGWGLDLDIAPDHASATLRGSF